jgi:hypothetical protein
MITWSKVYNTILDTVGRRVVRVYEIGPKTADQVSPFGDDSNPIQGMDAIYAESSNDGDPVILGYINTKQMAATGEKRLYSIKPKTTDTPYGTISFYVWFRNNGTLELNGDSDNLIRYAALNTALQSEVQRINTELQKISTAIGSLGGAYIVEPVSIDITSSKINEIKCT